MGWAIKRPRAGTAPGTRPRERSYFEMACGNCFQSPCVSREARYFSCTTCGNPAYECERCVRVATERDLAPVTTCAYCSLREEMNGDALSPN
ncbi:MAG: hypothetical protein ACLQVI_30680 [Polyangiaceae bacterium]